MSTVKVNRKILFQVFRAIHLAIFRIVLQFFPDNMRLCYLKIGDFFKKTIFPEFLYSNYFWLEKNSNEIPFKRTSRKLPKWIVNEMFDIGIHIDPELFPLHDLENRYSYVNCPIVSFPGEEFRKLLKTIKSNAYTHIFVVPWFKRGGADLVVMAHLKAIKKNGGNILVIVTEHDESPWLSKVSYAEVCELSKILDRALEYEDVLLILARLIIQIQPNVLHVINSSLGWRTIEKYGLAIKQRTKIFTSVFCDDYDENGRPIGYARQFLGSCYKNIDKVFSDNETYPKVLRRFYGYQEGLFCAIKSPIKFDVPVKKINKKDRSVLWAGRLDKQKRPDILLDVAKALPALDFFVYGESVLDKSSSFIDALRKERNIYLMGGFDGVENLPFNDFKVYLYTSQWDGIPTMILGAAMASIPIVASVVGGVGEVINENNGYPVYECDNWECYAKKIMEVFEDELLAKRKAECAYRLINDEFCFEKFERQLLNVSGYLS